MEMNEGTYFYDLMKMYFIVYLTEHEYLYRNNLFFLSKIHRDDKALGVYNAIEEMSYIGHSIVCVNFEKYFPVQNLENVTFTDSTSYRDVHHNKETDILIIYSNTDSCAQLCTKLSSYYHPKFIFYFS